MSKKSRKIYDGITNIDYDIIESILPETGKKRNWQRWGAAAACFFIVAAAVAAAWTGGLARPNVDPDDRSPDTSGYNVYIPSLEIPDSSAAAMDMIGCVVYKGGIYVQSQSYMGEDAERVAGLVGEKVGYARGDLREWSTQEDYAKELASTYRGDIYSVEGYSDLFRLCYVNEWINESGETVTHIEFLDRMNGIGLNIGEDLFGHRLNIRGNVTEVRYLTHDEWNSGSGNYKELTEISDIEFGAFVDKLYAGRFENTLETNPDIYSFHQVHLYLDMADGTVVELRVFDNGYVGYDPLGWYFVKLTPEDVAPFFSACK